MPAGEGHHAAALVLKSVYAVPHPRTRSPPQMLQVPSRPGLPFPLHVQHMLVLRMSTCCTCGGGGWQVQDPAPLTTCPGAVVPGASWSGLLLLLHSSKPYTPSPRRACAACVSSVARRWGGLVLAG